MSADNIEVLQSPDDIEIEGVDEFYFAVVFAGPHSAQTKITRRGVTTDMLGVLASKLQVMYEVEQGAQHQALLMQLAERAKLDGIAVPPGVKTRTRGH